MTFADCSIRITHWMPRVYQKVSITVTDEHICAAFNELELEVETEISADVYPDNHIGPGHFWYDDLEVGYPLQIDDFTYNKKRIEEILVPAQVKQLEQLLLNAVDPDAWPAEEDGYDPDGY